MAKEPAWLMAATTKMGVREIAGARHNPTILGWLKLLGAWWANDEEPWCGVFVAICLREAGIPIIKHWYRAKAWADWGVEVSPRLGALLVFGRTGGGHVGWYVGQTVRTVAGVPTLMYRVRGGNQGDRVCDTWIAADRLIACRWPAGVRVAGDRVQLAWDGGAASRDEA